MSDALARRLLKVCQLRGSFVLRSGETSSEYFDKYLFESDPALLLEVARAMVDLLPPCDVLGGMEMGGIPLVVVLSQLRQAGASVDTAVCAIDRDQGGPAALSAHGVGLRAAVERAAIDRVLRSWEDPARPVQQVRSSDSACRQDSV